MVLRNAHRLLCRSLASRLGEVRAHLRVNTATAVMTEALWQSLPLIGLQVRHPDEGGVVRRARGLSRPCPSTFAMTPPGLWLYDQCHTQRYLVSRCLMVSMTISARFEARGVCPWDREPCSQPPWGIMRGLWITTRSWRAYWRSLWNYQCLSRWGPGFECCSRYSLNYVDKFLAAVSCSSCRRAR